MFFIRKVTVRHIARITPVRNMNHCINAKIGNCRAGRVFADNFFLYDLLGTYDNAF
jgi:hypothetical protein